jgi:hypothetical protein
VKMLKILVLCSYYNRPKLVRNALKSVLRAGELHPNWVLAFGDDGSDVSGAPIVAEILGDQKDKIILVDTAMTFEEKLKKGITIGGHANRVMLGSDADVAIMLCDDDELDEFYFSNLNDYFLRNPQVLHAYSKIKIFNPLFQKSNEINHLDHKYNLCSAPIDPSGKVDASQVAWRIDCIRNYGVRFPETTMLVPNKPWAINIDRTFFESLFLNCGNCYPTGFVAQSKGIHDYQLVWHKNTDEMGLRQYQEDVKSKAGELF